MPHLTATAPSQPLVTIDHGQAVTTTFAIAEGTKNQHKNVLELVRTYLSDLEEFGRVAFETRSFETNGGTQQREVAILNEHQATLLLTYMRNSEVIRKFKKRLVREFFEMARANQSMTPAERLLASAQLLVDHERQLADLSYRQAETQAQVKALVDGEDYYTIVGYGNLIGEPVDTPRSRKLGRIASRICRDNAWRIGTANHPVYGPIHSYPRQAVAMAFDLE